jgi:NADH-quinone oxidoreductase subunit L
MLTFFGEYRGHAHPHESPWVVTTPLVLLAIPSLVFGYLYGESFIEYLTPWTRHDMVPGHEHDHMYHTLEIFSAAIAIVGISLAVVLYSAIPQFLTKLAKSFPILYKNLLNKWWVDEIYEVLVVSPLRGIAKLFFGLFDRTLIDGTVEGMAIVVQTNSDLVGRAHTGQITSSMIWMLGGTLFILIFYFVL